MKNLKLFLSAAFMAVVVFSACEPKDDPNKPPVEKEGGVIINGVCWAKCNVGTFGTFVANPEDAGMLYQWNRKTAWNDTDETVTGWDKSLPEGTTWAAVNDPSPAGWRLPTKQEFSSLFESGKVKRERVEVNGVYGIKVTDIATNKSIFFPKAAGYRYGNDGGLDVNRYGNYWSGTEYNSTSANIFTFDIGSWPGSTSTHYAHKTCGLSVRPVAK